MHFERIYFYKVDYDGNLYFENSLLTDLQFLNFFYSQIQYNYTGYYPEYKYISPCGKEMNFIECKDTPIVFRRLEKEFIIYGGNLKISFDPKNLIYLTSNSQLYYEFKNKVNQKLYGRIGKTLLIELSKDIGMDQDSDQERYYYKNFLIPSISTLEELFQKI